MKRSFLYIFALALLWISSVFAEDTKYSVVIPDDKGGKVVLYTHSYALIIGAVNYNNGWPVLNGVKEDVDAVRQKLQSQGFYVEVAMDPTSADFESTIKNFINKYGMDAQNRLLIYFAGHGHTIKATYGEEMGYIIPIDAPNPNKDKSGFLAKSLAMQQIEVFAKQIQSKHSLFIFDACFSGSLFAISRAIPENISYKTSKPVRQFITSGSASETVPDVSIFRRQFEAALDGEADLNRDGFVTGTELGEFLQDKVINYSKNAQHPQYGKIRNPNLDKGDYVFRVVPVEENIASAVETNSETRNIPAANKEVRTAFINAPVSWKSEFEDMSFMFGKIAIKTMNGHYFCADNGGGGEVHANRDNVSFWESFTLEPKGDKKFSLRAQNGQYISSENPLSLLANKTSAGENEIFEIIELDETRVAIKCASGKFLCSVSGGGKQITATSDKIKEHEAFTIVKLRSNYLKSFNGFYISLDNSVEGKIQVNKKEFSPNEQFEFVKADKNTVYIKALNNQYLGLDQTNFLSAKSKMNDENVKFEIIDTGKNKFALKAPNGKYVTAVGGGGFGLKAAADKIGDWETFEFIPSVK